MNNKTINKPKQNLRKKGFRTNSQVNIHKPSSLYTLEIEEKYSKKYGKGLSKYIDQAWKKFKNKG